MPGQFSRSIHLCVLACFVQGLVERTRAHPKYTKNYSFETDATWITASPCGEACAGLPQVLALDCEMCMSEVRSRFIVLSRVLFFTALVVVRRLVSVVVAMQHGPPQAL